MIITIRPSVLSGTVSAIASKSEAHRCLILAALADAPTRIIMNGSSEDIGATVSCLEAMGAEIEARSGSCTVFPIKKAASSPLLDCGESGSTLRFLLPAALAVCSGASFTGHGRLPQRPMDDLLTVLEQHGASFSPRALPMTARGRLQCGRYEINGDVSSQYISGLLMALPLLDGDSEIVLKTPLSSAGYVDITLSSMKKFGINAEKTENGFFIRGGQRPRSPGAVTVGGDWSNASFFLAAGAMAGSITVGGLASDSPQGDKAVCRVLSRFGADVTSLNNSVTVRHMPLHGCRVDVSDIPDALPVLAVVASKAYGDTVFTGGGRLRFKESDRLLSTSRMLRALGGNVTETDDGLIVRHSRLTGGETDSFGDHRIAMAAAAAACVCSGSVTINGAESTNKSYPGFWEDFEQAGGIITDRR